MDYFIQFMSNHIFWSSVFACFLAQFLKIFSGKKAIEVARIFTSGGMPSSHSSFVTCMSTMVGLQHGFDSSIFAIAFIISCIVMYDASGVRQAVGKHANVINQLIEDLIEDLQHKRPIQQEKLKELIGHTPKQVFFGALLGIAVGIVLY